VFLDCWNVLGVVIAVVVGVVVLVSCCLVVSFSYGSME